VKISTGDLVTRHSHGHDTLFRTSELRPGPGGVIALLTSCLEGWSADAPVSDLLPVPDDLVMEAIRRELRIPTTIS